MTTSIRFCTAVSLILAFPAVVAKADPAEQILRGVFDILGDQLEGQIRQGNQNQYRSSLPVLNDVERENNRRYVASALNEKGDKYKIKAFLIDVPSHYRSSAIRYVQEIGGTPVVSGGATYILRINESISNKYAALEVEAQILTQDENTNIVSISFYSSDIIPCERFRSGNQVRFNCDLAQSAATYDILYKFR